MTHILVNLGYLLMLIALMVRDILWLRSILISGQLALAVVNIMTDNDFVAFWMSVFVIINTVQVIRILRERRQIEIPSDLIDLYEEVFPVMTRREFLYFWQTGTIHNAHNDLLTEEGECQKMLSLILSGTVSVVRDKHEIAELTRGSFIAEMSFLSGDPASADVIAKGEVQYISWAQEKLRRLKQLNPQLLIKIQSVLGKDLADKVKSAST